MGAVCYNGEMSVYMTCSMHVQHCVHSSVCSVKLKRLHMPYEENGGFYCIPLVSGTTNV